MKVTMWWWRVCVGEEKCFGLKGSDEEMENVSFFFNC